MEKTAFGRERTVLRRKKEPEYESIQLSSAKGLTEEQVVKNRKKYGKNALTPKKQKGFFAFLYDSFKDPIIKILIASLILNAVVSMGKINIPETMGIVAAIMIATTVSAVSEYSSSLAFEKLKSSETQKVFVKRNGEIITVSENDLVVGDIVYITSGENVPADGFLIKGEITCNQAALTGESREIVKKSIKAKWVVAESIDWSTENINQVFKGSAVCGGEGEMCVLNVGDATFIGKVAESLQENNRPSPLKHRLTNLAKSISFLGYTGAFMIAFAYLFNSFVICSGMNINEMLIKLSDKQFVLKEIINAVTLSVSAIVLAVPEGLPMLVTVVLSSNMKKMLKSGVLVRRLVGIETAGSMNTLFTDKTGTLTTGKMTVESVFFGNDFCAETNKALPSVVSKIISDGITATCGVLGSSTESAVKKFIGKKGTEPIKRIPFSSDKKYSAGFNGEYSFFLGAAEKLFKKSVFYVNQNGADMHLTESDRKKVEEVISANAEKSCRMLCLARKSGDYIKGTDIEELSLVCLFAIKDPLRKDAVKSVKEAQEAGIHVVMVTGDNPKTAKAIGKEVGIVNEKYFRVVEAEELHKMTDEKVKEILPGLAVVARALPTDKIRLVKLSQETGEVVGMTGDGINDAPALRAADVGFAMGGGTEIAKEAGDIVITDNSFTSITKAVLFGRTIFESIRKFIVFQLLMNLSAMGVSLIGPFVGVPKPVTVIQMLWVNIIMDTLGGLAFAGEPALKEYMKRKPLKRDTPILSKKMLWQIMLTGAYTLSLSIFFLKSPKLRAYFGGDDKYYLTAFFAMFILCGIFNSFNARTDSINVMSNLSKNKGFMLIMTTVAFVQLLIIYFGGEIFRCVPLEIKHLFASCLIAATVIPADSIRKMITNSLKKSAK